MIRAYSPSDAAAVLALNQANLPDVGPMDEEKLALLSAEAFSFDVVEVASGVVGALISLSEGSSYQSPNYRWFSGRYPHFVYVDRVMLAEEARGHGWGPALYTSLEKLATAAGKPVMLAEVNTVPRNDRSLRFHELFGFTEVGREHPYGGEEEVAMLMRPLNTTSAS